MSWLHVDMSRDVDAPVVNAAGFRSPETLITVVGQFEIESAARYRKRDVTGDGKAETWCSHWVRDVTRALGCPLPRIRASHQVRVLGSEMAEAAGWSRVSLADALTSVNRGEVVVAGWDSGSEVLPGHIALCVPSLNHGLCIANVGSTNFSCGLLREGFGNLKVQLFHHF